MGARHSRLYTVLRSILSVTRFNRDSGMRRLSMFRLIAPEFLLQNATRVASIGLLVCLTSCGSSNPFNVAEGQGTFLENRGWVQVGGAMYFNKFHHANGEFLTAGLMDRDHHSVFTIPPGEVTVTVKISYFHKRPKLLSDPDIAWAGLTFDALQGETYHIECRVKDHVAHIWIEDAANNRVSETVIAPNAYNDNFINPVE